MTLTLRTGCGLVQAGPSPPKLPPLCCGDSLVLPGGAPHCDGQETSPLALLPSEGIIFLLTGVHPEQDQACGVCGGVLTHPMC